MSVCGPDAPSDRRRSTTAVHMGCCVYMSTRRFTLEVSTAWLAPCSARGWGGRGA